MVLNVSARIRDNIYDAQCMHCYNLLRRACRGRTRQSVHINLPLSQIQRGRAVTRHGLDPSEGTCAQPTRRGSRSQNIKSEPPEPPKLMT